MVDDLRMSIQLKRLYKSLPVLNTENWLYPHSLTYKLTILPQLHIPPLHLPSADTKEDPDNDNLGSS